MGSVKLQTPLLLQSKLLCLSVLYLLTTLPLSIYVSFSQTGCLFTSPPSLPPTTSPQLISYPSTYGEHKYALPTTRSSCVSPLPFQDYDVAFNEIHDLCINATTPPMLRYMRAKRDSFAGNLSTQKRKSFFNHGDGVTELVPCGFFSEFPLKESDRMAMENCTGVVVVSAVFGDHDKIRQPKGLGSKTLETVCFYMFLDDTTIKGLERHNVITTKGGGRVEMVGAWRVARVGAKLPYKNPAMNGVIPKYLVHRLFPNSKFSIWVDAKLQLTADPFLLIHSLLVSKDAHMALSKHPLNVHTMEEAMATARWKKWGDVECLRVQMETYCENGLQPWTPSKLPYTTDVPDTALIVRRHELDSNLFSCLMFNEMEAFNPRDQVAFAYVRDLMNPKVRMNMFEAEVLEQVAVEYRHNIKGNGTAKAAAQSARKASRQDIEGSKCEGYLLKMWGESNDVEN